MVGGASPSPGGMGVVEAGSTGGAVAGYITIDSGAMLQGVGTTSGQIQNNGGVISTNTTTYDLLGRAFRLGVRFNY